MKTQIKLVLGALVLIGFSAHAQWGLVVNWGFDSGDFTGWTGPGGGTIIGYSGQFSELSQSGDCYVYFNNEGSDDFISQTIADHAGTTYNLSYWVAGHNNGTSDVHVYWNNILVSMVPDPIPGGGCVEHSTFVIGTGSDVLAIGLRSDGWADVFDSVSLTAVPDCVLTMTTLSAAMIGLGGISRKLRR